MLVASVKVDWIPHKRYIRSFPKFEIVIEVTDTADAILLFYWTNPDTNSTQYPLMPRIDVYKGFWTCVDMQIVWPAVIWFIENVIVERSEDIWQKLSTAADKPVPADTDWHNPIKLKSSRVVPLLWRGYVES